MNKYLVILLVLFCTVSLFATQAITAPLVLNEYNAVAKDDVLKDGGADAYFGQILGNGGDWVELVVVEDHLDIQGWTLRWLEENGEGNGQATAPGVWDPSRVSAYEAQGTITFANHPLWADLRAGTIITLSENTSAATFDLSTDTSFDPGNDDWWIHVSTQGEAGGASPLVTTAINVDGDPAGSFTVGKSNWELTIVDETGAIVSGPVGEAVPGWDNGGVGSGETGRLETNPNMPITLDDYDDAAYSSFGLPNVWSDYTKSQDFSELRAWAVPEPTTWALLLTLASLGLLIRRK